MSNDTIYLSNGGYVVLPANAVNNDNDSTNELITAVTFTGDSVHITDAAGTKSVDLASLNQSGDVTSLYSKILLDSNALRSQINTNATGIGTNASNLSTLTTDVNSGAYKDSSATNEIQVLSILGDSISLSNGGGKVGLPKSTMDTLSLIRDADNDTKIQLEKNTDEDIIRFDLGGTEMFRFEKDGQIQVYTTNKATLLGAFAGEKLTSGTNNTFIGYEAGANNTSGSNNTFLGFNAGKLNTGANNTAVGTYSGDALIGGQRNTLMGLQSGSGLTSGNDNLMLGHNAGRIASTAEQNVYLGSGAGEINTGKQNIMIGYQAGGTISNSDNLLIIDNSSSTKPLIYGDFNTDSLRFNSSLSIQHGLSLPTGAGIGKVPTPDANGFATWQTPASGADNLGNHTMTQNLLTNGKYISSDGDNEGLLVENDGDMVFQGGSATFRDTNGYDLTLIPDSGASGIDLFSYGTGQFGASTLDFYQQRGKKGSPLPVANNDYVMELSAVPYNGSYYSKSILQSEVDGVLGTGSKIPISTTLYSWDTTGGVGAYIHLFPRGTMSVNGGTGNYSLSVEGDIAADSLFVDSADVDALSINGNYYFPTTAGSNGQVLQTDASGKLTWQTPSSSPWTVTADTTTTSAKYVGIGDHSKDARMYIWHNVVGSQSSGLVSDVFGTSVTSDVYGIQGMASNGYTNYGIYGNATGGTNNWAGYFENGNVYIENSLQLPSGAGSGKVLTSDGSGFASWQSAATSPWNLASDTIFTSNKYVGIGTGRPIARLSVADSLTSTSSEIGLSNSIYSNNTTGNAFGFKTTLMGEVDRSYGIHSTLVGSVEDFAKSYGIHSTVAASGIGTDAADFYAGYFKAYGSHNPSGSEYYGIYAEASGAETNYALWATASGGSDENFAAYFDNGKVQINNKLIVGGSFGNNADSALNVKGGIKTDYFRMYKGGGAGKVLTSDANGNATWQTPASSADGNGIYDGSGSLSGNTVVTQGTNTLGFAANATNGFSVDGSTFSVDGANNRVGIGTTSPSSPLTVQPSSTSNFQQNGIYVNNNNTGATESAFITTRVQNSSGSPVHSWDIDSKGGYSIAMSQSDTALHFYRDPNPTGTKIMTLTRDYKVGIGTTTVPSSSKMRVVGEIWVDSLRIRNTASTTYAQYGIYNWMSGTGSGKKTAVVGTTSGGSGAGVGVIGVAQDGGVNKGIEGYAAGGTTNWAGYFGTGNVYIGQTLQLASGAGAGKILTSDASGNASWTTLVDTLTCPAGFSKANEKFCISTAERTATSWFNAAADCADEDAELPSYVEWYTAADLLVLTGETDNNEWVSNISQNNMMIVGNGGITNRAFQDPTLTAPYRCVYKK